MNVILDTNTLVSGLYFKGTPYRILRAWRAGHFVLFVSAEIFNEYSRVIHELSHLKSKFNPDKAIAFLHKNLKNVKPFHLSSQVCTDGDDDKFLACALAVKAVIVTGDKALLKCDGYKNLKIMTCAQFEKQYLI
jgi:putative PIN family toxin of toxin-antitoxin system